MNFNSIPAGTSMPDDFNAIIEIPADALPVKYEADKALNLFRVDRFLSTSMRYPANYGFVPSTLSRDGDPVDVLVVAPYPIQTGALVRCRPIGLMKMTDEAGEDAKVIAVPIDKICAASVGIEVLSDLGEPLLRRIEHFFTYYKSLEPGKWVRFEGWGDIDVARKELLDAQASFKPHT